MKTMADEIDLENLDTEIEKDSKVEKRIKDLSEKVRLTSEERDEQKRILGERDKKIADLEKENAFNTGFVDVLVNHSAAKDHKDEIKAKVLSGYSVEDATFAVLGKAGKLGQPKTVEIMNPAGGSATTQPVVSSGKTVSQLTREEKRAKLMEAEASGEISMT
mgnify:CR=1 FL=1